MEMRVGNLLNLWFKAFFRDCFSLSGFAFYCLSFLNVQLCIFWPLCVVWLVCSRSKFSLGFLTKLSFIGWDLFEKLHSWQSIRKIIQLNPILKNCSWWSVVRGKGQRRRKQIINRDKKCIFIMLHFCNEKPSAHVSELQCKVYELEDKFRAESPVIRAVFTSFC